MKRTLAVSCNIAARPARSRTHIGSHYFAMLLRENGVLPRCRTNFLVRHHGTSSGQARFPLAPARRPAFSAITPELTHTPTPTTLGHLYFHKNLNVHEHFALLLLFKPSKPRSRAYACFSDNLHFSGMTLSRPMSPLALSLKKWRMAPSTDRRYAVMTILPEPIPSRILLHTLSLNSG